MEDIEAAFEEILNTPNWGPDQKSRTMYQLDKSFDYIELKLVEFAEILLQHQQQT